MTGQSGLSTTDTRERMRSKRIKRKEKFGDLHRSKHLPHSEQILIAVVLCAAILAGMFMLNQSGLTGFSTFEKMQDYSAMGTPKMWNNTFDTTGKNISGVWNITINAVADWFYSTELANRNFTLNTKPGKVVLYLPTNGYTSVVERYTNFTWYNATDAEEDTVRYHIMVDDNETFNNPEINTTVAEGSGFTSYISTYELSLNTTYYWKVQAYEDKLTGGLYGEFSDVWNFSIEEYKAITVIVPVVDFGSMNVSTNDATDDNNPPPIVVENSGNIPVNLTINGTAIWITAAGNYWYYMGVNESNSFNESASVTSWTLMPLTPPVSPQCIDLGYKDSNDTAEIEINVTSPSKEPPGAKSSEILITS